MSMNMSHPVVLLAAVVALCFISHSESAAVIYFNATCPQNPLTTQSDIITDRVVSAPTDTCFLLPAQNAGDPPAWGQVQCQPSLNQVLIMKFSDAKCSTPVARFGNVPSDGTCGMAFQLPGYNGAAVYVNCQNPGALPSFMKQYVLVPVLDVTTCPTVGTSLAASGLNSVAYPLPAQFQCPVTTPLFPSLALSCLGAGGLGKLSICWAGGLTGIFQVAPTTFCLGNDPNLGPYQANC